MVSWTYLVLAGLAAAQRNEKRGLCFVPNEDHPEDNQLWAGSDSDLSWYYNYQERPSPAYSDLSQDEFEFIPMMWGVGPDPDDTTWLNQVRQLMDDGLEVRHVLGFNEPDGPNEYGGSDVAPALAARAWVANFEPLAEMGVKLGLPACTGGWGGMPWLRQFLGNCSELLSTDDERRNCTWDFLPVHWYDNFGGLASHIGERLAEWPDAEIWITEYAYAHQDLAPTQEFYNQSIDYFDREDFIGRYTYFGAFRSDNSNVGPNAVFLNNAGELTDIGALYLGQEETGVDPQSWAAPSARVPAGLLLGAVLLALL
ncbi:hypothetical protein S7711_04110 [Stachybotrys chartarum IBT 7711]|uniref:Asl1-like glycosyl hydrolase catalytic domain-containing protein n=1 Tax=Stachybotrys chartarum (strain CBS 109288 / IBT 7711) TaxID=1280523 RepID=A0A084AR67_STACB|nr:hypothetical protein S7711_04110 [Stachybotrys chartarum IBT 7711]KFA45578.1 hypothetical protein S40293_06578 [Stachybotrys chartarum IBT 40293]KFA71576.1 hypothetical protein S40288_08342 [Stachybotrys chartarum IBT 40288]